MAIFLSNPGEVTSDTLGRWALAPVFANASRFIRTGASAQRLLAGHRVLGQDRAPSQLNEDVESRKLLLVHEADIVVVDFC